MRRFAQLVRLTLVAVALAIGLAGGARAQDDGGNTFITPFPEGDTYKVHLVGDWWAEGLIEGLVEGFAGDSRVQIARKRHAINTMFRAEIEEDIKALDELVTREKLHVVVIMLGMSDRVSVRLANGKRAPVGSDEWKADYTRRVDRIIRAVRRPGVGVYWVSQPKLGREEADEDAQMMNEIVRERVYLNGLKYVDIHAVFADEQGNYRQHGPDLTGKYARLRDAEGVGFTGTGYRKVAHFVERELKRDIAQARSERAIPLAGTEAEQARIGPQRQDVAARPGQAPATGTAGAKTAVSAPAPAVARADGSLEQKADNGRIALRVVGTDGREQTVQMEILRPAIPASVVALMARRQAADKSSQPGDVVTEDIPGGLTVLSTITPANETATSRRRLSPTQTAYFRVLVKGERLQPKPGRADDFSWPRSEAALPAALVGAPAADAKAAPRQPTPAQRQRMQRGEVRE